MGKSGAVKPSGGRSVSGLSRVGWGKEFCEREAIALGSFKKWYPRCTESSPPPGAFVELASPPIRSDEAWAVEVELPSGVRVRFRG
jgi:hypothetical protein